MASPERLVTKATTTATLSTNEAKVAAEGGGALVLLPRVRVEAPAIRTSRSLDGETQLLRISAQTEEPAFTHGRRETPRGGLNSLIVPAGIVAAHPRTRRTTLLRLARRT